MIARGASAKRSVTACGKAIAKYCWWCLEISVHGDGSRALQHQEGLSQMKVVACVLTETVECNRRLMENTKGGGLKSTHFAEGLVQKII